MSRKPFLSLCFVFLCLALLLGGFLPGRAASSSSTSSGFNPAGSASTYLPIMLRDPLTLYVDNFTVPSGGWPEYETEDLGYSYQDGEYQMWLANPGWWTGAVNIFYLVFDNYSLQADMHRELGQTTEYGLIFDWVDWDHFYVFWVEPTNQIYWVLKRDSGSWIGVIPPAVSTSINTGFSTNTLRVEREGDSLRAYMNDQFLASGNDTTFPIPGPRLIGFYGESQDDSPAALRYDNFIVRSLSAVNTFGSQADNSWGQDWSIKENSAGGSAPLVGPAP